VDPLESLIGESPAMGALRRQVGSLLQRVSALRRLPPVLILGETGTGKTMLARLIHRASARSAGPLVEVNCPGIPETMIERELFGHERHAFTDAGRGKPGLFQAAHGGVLFLDEIGLVPMAVQAKLLKAVDEGTVRRLGATKTEAVDVAIIAATSENLPAALREGRFREDLYNRLAVLTLEMPPLRDRGRDIELLADRLLARACAEYGIPAKVLSDGARAALRAYAWPGNVRELGNVLERVVLSSDARNVSAEMLALSDARRAVVGAPDGEAAPDDPARARLAEALARTSWNITRTATALRLTRKTVRARIQRYGLQPEAPRTGPSARQSTAAPAKASSNPPGAPPHASGERSATLSAAPISRVRWDRRRVSYLSVRLPTLGPDPTGAGARILDTLVDKIQSFGGRVEELSPHSVFAAFGLEPTEDAPRRAANAAIAIMKWAERERQAARTPGESHAPAIGIHVSRPRVARFADVANIDQEAKREAIAVLDRLAPSTDEILVSDKVVPFLERHFEIVRLVRGDDVVQRLGGPEPAAAGARGTTFADRVREIDLLHGLLQRAMDGQGQIVSVVGEAGVGKSRLVRELQRTLPAEAVTVLQGRCVSYGTNVPYLPVLDILHAVCGIQETDPLEVVDAKVRAVLERFGPTAEPWAPYVLHLIHPRRDTAVSDSTPEAVKGRTFEALHQLVIEQQARRPLLLVVEDLQWIDRTSEELLAALALMLTGLRILLVTTHRPGYQPSWIGKSYATQIALGPLSPVDGQRLVESVVGDASSVQPLVAAIIRRGEGNPFFLEELSYALLERTESLGSKVPDTVRDVIAARADHLADGDLHVLRAAAVIGADVSFLLLRAVCDLPEENVRASVGRLQAAEFLYTTHVTPEPEYRFKHALIYDVVYESVPDDERGVLHDRAARAIDRLAPEMRERRPETLARHCTHAGRPREAITHWHRAAQLAIERSAYTDAMAHIRQALALLEAEPEGEDRANREVMVQLTLATALTATRGYAAPEVGLALARTRTLADQLADPAQRFSVRWSLWRFHLSRADLRTAEELAVLLLPLTESPEDPLVRVGAYVATAIDKFYLGEFAVAREYLERAVDLYDHGQAGAYVLKYGQDLGLAALGFLGWVHAIQGDLGRAADLADQMVRLAHDLRQPFSLALALFLACEIHKHRNDAVLVRSLGDGLVALSREHSFTLFSGIGLMHSGWAQATTGDLPGGLAAIEQGAELFQSVGQRIGLLRRARLAEALIASGNVEAGLDVVEEALTQVEETEERAFVSELIRLKAEGLRRRGETRLAQELLREAVAQASHQGAWLFALRAATTLAGLDAEGAELVGAIRRRLPPPASSDPTIARDLLEDQR
jgi:transcriptional regulator with AAA-type ATPase domain/tetratricopeptide (TPR) repeat protein/energy-coupling factor transporter ATP-binding protein EcfA2